MDTFTKKDVCDHNLMVKLQSGVNVVNIKPLISHDSLNIIIACGTDIRIFAIKSGECIQTLKYHSRPVISLRENKNNFLQIFSCSDDGVVVRWDYTGRILQIYDLQIPVTNLYVPSPGEVWFVTKKFEDHLRLYSVIPKKGCSKVTMKNQMQPTTNTRDLFIPKESGCSSFRMILKQVQPKENTIDFDPMGKYLASINENNLTIYKFDSKSIIRHKTGERKLTCVACHPSDPVLATGDHTGRVIVWHNALDSNHPITSIYHWHHLAVADLAFSPEGSHLYSGNGEGGIVKWNLQTEDRIILPRLGAPIEYIVSSKHNSYVVTTHSDNVVQVIDSQRNIVQVIQSLTRSEPLYGELLPTGLLYDSNLKALVMNGKPGHLQFYDSKQEKQLFNLDIAAKNFFSQNRDTAVYNIEVQKAAFNDTGMWLATTEFWCNNELSFNEVSQIWLKFWKFDLEKQTFTLNTNVYLPHNKELNCILFRPSCSFDECLSVTTSKDGKFKIWTLSDNVKDNKQCWNCKYENTYRGLTPSSTSFSEDGSLLAVAFEHVPTLWDVSRGLSHKKHLFTMKRNIKQLLFGRQLCAKYLICHDGSSIVVWDCTEKSKICWVIDVEVQVLVGDIMTDNIAAFCKMDGHQNLKIFKPSSPEILDCIENVSDSTIISAIFVPSANVNNISGCFQEKSQLFFMDEAQNLFTLSQSEEEEQVAYTEKKTIAQNLVATPFGMLQAVQTVSDVKKAKSEQFNITDPEEETNIFSNPTWQDTRVLFRAFISKVLIPREKNKEETPKSQTYSEVPSEGKECNNEGNSCIFDEDWRSKAFNSIDPNTIYDDFSFLAKHIKFIE